MRTRRSSHAASSSSLNAFASDSIGTRCVCLASWLSGSAPTRCVGESAVRSVGCASSSSSELAIQPVVLRVGDRRLVEHVVLVRRALELSAEGGGARRQLAQRRRHPLASSSMTCIATPTSRSSSSSDALGRSALRPGLIVARGVAVEQPAEERDERDALEIARGAGPRAASFWSRSSASKRCALRSAFAVSEATTWQKRTSASENGCGVAVGAQEDRADDRRLPLNRHARRSSGRCACRACP